MNNILVIVADRGAARFFRLEAVDAPRIKARLVEGASLQHPDFTEREDLTGRPHTETNSNRQAGPVHPIEAQRERHRLEHGRHFSHDIAHEAVDTAKNWKEGTVVLVAEPRVLGLLREPMASPTT